MLNPNLGSFVNKTNLGGINKLNTPKQVELQPKDPDGPELKTSAVYIWEEGEPFPPDANTGDFVIRGKGGYIIHDRNPEDPDDILWTFVRDVGKHILYYMERNRGDITG